MQRPAPLGRGRPPATSARRLQARSCAVSSCTGREQGAAAEVAFRSCSCTTRWLTGAAPPLAGLPPVATSPCKRPRPRRSPPRPQLPPLPPPLLPRARPSPTHRLRAMPSVCSSPSRVSTSSRCHFLVRGFHDQRPPPLPAPVRAANPPRAAAGAGIGNALANSHPIRSSPADISVLVDPWLVGKLTFGGLDFVYAGSKREASSGRHMGGQLVESGTTFLASSACGCAGGLSWPQRRLQWPSTAVGVHLTCQGVVAFSCILYCRHFLVVCRRGAGGHAGH